MLNNSFRAASRALFSVSSGLSFIFACFCKTVFLIFEGAPESMMD
jgi:hypothetical protein